MTRLALITPYGFQNQGVRLLSAVLRGDRFDAPVLYFKRWVNNDVRPPTEAEYRLFERYIADLQPDVVGIGFGTPYLKIVRRLVKHVRKATDAHVILGGVHPTIAPEDCIDWSDSVCVGEGEGPLLDLACAIRDEKDISGIPNLWVRSGPATHQNELRPLISNLDDLPYTELFGAETTVIEAGRLSRQDPLAASRFYRIYASRGCPFRCAFCYNNQFRRIYSDLGAYHRRRSVKSVLDELSEARSRLPHLRRVRFDDDSFVFPRSWIEDFAGAYPRQIGLPFDLLLHPEAYDEGAVRQLAGAGLCAVQVGIQTGSQRELKADFERQGSPDHIVALARLLRDLKIRPTFDVILDNPLSTTEDKRVLVDLLLKLPRPFNLYLYSLTVFPKTDTARKLLEAGRITENDIEGKASKSFRQFRLSLDYPRPAEETFFACLVALTSKGFVPRSLIRRLSRSPFLRRHPAPLRLMTEVANAVKLGGVAFSMLINGELSLFKLREYGTFRRRIIQ